MVVLVLSSKGAVLGAETLTASGAGHYISAPWIALQTPKASLYPEPPTGIHIHPTNFIYMNENNR